METLYQDMKANDKIVWLERECRRLSQLIEHGRLNDLSVLYPDAIPVSEQPAPDGQFFGFHGVEGWVKAIGVYDDGWTYTVNDKGTNAITHWLPLPPDPE